MGSYPRRSEGIGSTCADECVCVCVVNVSAWGVGTRVHMCGSGTSLDVCHWAPCWHHQPVTTTRACTCSLRCWVTQPLLANHVHARSARCQSRDCGATPPRKHSGHLAWQANCMQRSHACLQRRTWCTQGCLSLTHCTDWFRSGLQLCAPLMLINKRAP